MSVEKCEDGRSASEELIMLRCAVAAINSNGEPDLFFVKVVCTEDDFENGRHYVAAYEAAEAAGYDGKVAYDERDNAGEAMLQNFVWESASVVTVQNASEEKCFEVDVARSAYRHKTIRVLAGSSAEAELKALEKAEDLEFNSPEYNAAYETISINEVYIHET